MAGDGHRLAADFDLVIAGVNAQGPRQPEEAKESCATAEQTPTDPKAQPRAAATQAEESFRGRIAGAGGTGSEDYFAWLSCLWLGGRVDASHLNHQ